MPPTPEAQARQQIDAQLVAAGWLIQDVKAVNLSAGPGIALREVHHPSPTPSKPASIAGSRKRPPLAPPSLQTNVRGLN